MLSFWRVLFLVQPFMLFVTSFFLLVFSFVVLVLSFSQKSNSLFWVCFSTFLCFVLLCSDLKVVFKRIIYPVLTWC